MIQGNLFNKRNQRGAWGVVKDFFEVGIRIVLLSDVLIDRAICQDVLAVQLKITFIQPKVVLLIKHGLSALHGGP